MSDAEVHSSELEPTDDEVMPAAGDDAQPDAPVIESEEPEEAEATLEEPAVEAEVEAEPEPEPEAEELAEEPVAEPEAEPEPEVEIIPAAEVAAPTLDEMVASLATESETAEPDVDVAAGSEDAPAAEADSDEAAADAPADVSPVAEPIVLEEPEPKPAEPRPLPYRMSVRVPFWVEFAVFVGFTGYVTYLLWPVSAAAFVSHPLYSVLVLGGVALVVIELVTGLAVHLLARNSANEDEKVGLAGIIWTRALTWTAASVAVWWIGFIVSELHRAGMLG